MPNMRALGAIKMAGLTPLPIEGELPVFEMVDPRILLVEDDYQRNPSERSIALTRKIYTAFSWLKYKPPIVVSTENGLVVVDGQHTCIAAASRADIEKIPVMRISADDLASRARSFIAHNRNRVNVTAIQMYYASLVGGDEDALTIAQVCQRAGVTIRKFVPYDGFGVGDTMAIQGIQKLVAEHGAMRARQILEILVVAGRAPITASDLRAVEFLLFDRNYGVNPGKLIDAITALNRTVDRDAKIKAANEKIRLWKAVALLYFEEAQRDVRRAS